MILIKELYKINQFSSIFFIEYPIINVLIIQSLKYFVIRKFSLEISNFPFLLSLSKRHSIYLFCQTKSLNYRLYVCSLLHSAVSQSIQIV